MNDKWLNRLIKKGPYYLLRQEPYRKEYYGGNIEEGHSYEVIWNDGPKTKIGCLHDYMYSSYGIGTRAVLNGTRPHDLWNGHLVTDEEFRQMLAVQKGESLLPKFDPYCLKNIR